MMEKNREIEIRFWTDSDPWNDMADSAAKDSLIRKDIVRAMDKTQHVTVSDLSVPASNKLVSGSGLIESVYLQRAVTSAVKNLRIVRGRR